MLQLTLERGSQAGTPFLFASSTFVTRRCCAWKSGYVLSCSSCSSRPPPSRRLPSACRAWGSVRWRSGRRPRRPPRPPCTQTLAGQRITFADESAAWDWQAGLPGRPGDLGAAVAQPHPHDPGDAHRRNQPGRRHGRRRLSRHHGPGRHRLRRVRRQARPGLLSVAIKQGAAGDDLNVAVTAAIPHAIRNAWLIHAPGGAEQIAALRKNWSWEQFQPLLQKEGAQWRSSCLSVSQP